MRQTSTPGICVLCLSLLPFDLTSFPWGKVERNYIYITLFSSSFFCMVRVFPAKRFQLTGKALYALLDKLMCEYERFTFLLPSVIFQSGRKCHTQVVFPLKK